MDVSEYENMPVVGRVQSDSIIYETLNNVLDTASNSTLQYFCPFCMEFFQFKFSLMEHLRVGHQHFLLEVMDKTISFYQCPFCKARFYGPHLTSKHALEHHPNVIGEMYLECKNGRLRGQGFVASCLFCKEKFKDFAQAPLAAHIKEKHYLEFYELFQDQFLTGFKPVFMDQNHLETNVTEPCDFTNASKTNCFDMDDLVMQIDTLRPDPAASNHLVANPCKSILKTPPSYIPRVSSKASAKKVLRFDVPESPDFSVDSVKDASVLSIANQDNFLKPIHSSTPNKPKLRDSPNKLKTKELSVNHGKYFSCGKCARKFASNDDLVVHIRMSHRQFSTNLWHPLYRCAVCNVKFFKSTYLKKHMSLHSKDSFQKCV